MDRFEENALAFIHREMALVTLENVGDGDDKSACLYLGHCAQKTADVAHVLQDLRDQHDIVLPCIAQSRKKAPVVDVWPQDIVHVFCDIVAVEEPAKRRQLDV